jgi:hypothetical protein
MNTLVVILIVVIIILTILVIFLSKHAKGYLDPGDANCINAAMTYVGSNYLTNGNVTGQTSKCTYGVYSVTISRYKIFGADPATSPFAVSNPIAAIPAQTPTYTIVDINQIQPYNLWPTINIDKTNYAGVAGIQSISISQPNSTAVTINTSYISKCTALGQSTCTFVPAYAVGSPTAAPTSSTSNVQQILMYNNSGSSSVTTLAYPFSSSGTAANNFYSIVQFTLVITNATPNVPLTISIAALNTATTPSPTSIVGTFYIVPPIANFNINVQIGD